MGRLVRIVFAVSASSLHIAFLYEEAGSRRRMMSISLHDRLSGRPSRVRSLERGLEHIMKHKGVWFARRDEIAKWALSTPDITPHIDRGSAAVSGLPSYP